MAEVKRRFRRTWCFHHLCPGASNFRGMSVKFHTKFTCPTALTASNSTHRTCSKSASSSCLALTKITCHNCHRTEPHYLVLLTFLVLCFLRCKNERLMWWTLPFARWWHYRPLNLLFSPMKFGIEFLYKNCWKSMSFVKIGVVTVILYSNESIILYT